MAVVQQPDLSRARVLVVGDVMLDRYWFGDVHRISPEAPVPVVHVRKVEERLGGAANVARNCVALGARTLLLSVVGPDEPGQRLREICDEQQVPASLHTDEGLTTTVKLRIIGQRQQLLRLDFEQMPDHEVLQAKLQDFENNLAHHDAVIFSDYAKGGLLHIRAMIDKARDRGVLVLVDPKGEDYQRYAHANLIAPNRAELTRVIGPWSSEDMLTEKAQALRRTLQLEVLLLTRSEEGMSLYSEQGVIHQPTVAHEVYDVSGAGDTVISAMAVMRALRYSWQESMQIANRAAGIVVARLGTSVATPKEIWSSHD